MKINILTWFNICYIFHFQIKPIYSSYLDSYHNECHFKSSYCEPLSNTSCLSVTLPYKYTRIAHFGDSHLNDELKVRKYLSEWTILQSLPRCWTSLQSFLCTLYLPKCDNDKVYPPSYEMCKTARNNCKFIEMYFGADKVPPFLNCSQQFFRPKCRNVYQDLKFNSSSAKCKYPLVPTEDSNIWYPGIEGCGLHCENPLLTEKERNKLSNFIKYGAGLSSLFTLLCILTFLVDWKSSNRYPAVIIFYINVCIFLSNIGWLLQFWFTKQEIVCRPDNTSRYGEPDTSENFYCLLVFFLIYYFSVAALVWFSSLLYLWNLNFRRVHDFREYVSSNKSYFHLSAWSIPLIFTIIIIAFGEVDSNSTLGICFVGYNKPIVRISSVFAPFIGFFVIGVYFSFKSVKALINAKTMRSSRLINNKGEAEINKMIIKLVSFIVYIFCSFICTIICHTYEYTNSHIWSEALKQRVICSLNVASNLDPDQTMECRSKISPNLFYTYLQLCAVFGNGIAASLWTFTSSSFEAWRRIILKKCRANLNDPVRLKKHEVISKAYNRRNQITQGCYSPSFQSMHGDPVDMNLTSATSQDLSSTWAAALPYFLSRRGAVTKHNNGNHYLQDFPIHNNNNSSISDISQQRFSLDSFASHQRSFDSQFSFEQEMAAIVRHQRRKTKKERERLIRSQNRFALSLRRGSDTSSHSLAPNPLKNCISTNKPVTKSTSTGDLHAQISNSLPFPSHDVPSLFNFNHPVNCPLLTSTLPIFSKKKSAKPLSSAHPFTHGMSQQSDALINPLEEKRRPDSRAIVLSSKIGVSKTSFKACDSNLSQNYNYSCFYSSQQASLMFNPMSQFFNPNLLVTNGSANSYVNYFGFSGTPLPNPNQTSIYNPFYNYHSYFPFSNGGCQNLEELQNLVREREACLPLITGVDSSSEVGELLPIQISDSEGFTDGGIKIQSSPFENLKSTQQMVDEHIQKVEAKAEAEAEAEIETQAEVETQPEAKAEAEAETEAAAEVEAATKGK